MPDAGWRLGHLAVLWAFAVVQPLLDLLGRNAEFFVARGNGAADIVVFSLALALVPPSALLGLEALAGVASRRLAWALHLAFAGLLAGAFFLQVVDGVVDARTLVVLGVAALLGGAAALAYARGEAARSLLSFLLPAPAVFLILFLFFSDASKLVLPQDEANALAAGSGKPLVMVAFDELPTASLMDRTGRINARRFPNLAGFAEDATWYENATTVADHTDDAIPVLLTGNRPDPGLDPLASDHPNNLFTLLAGSQALNVHERTARLCPREYCDVDTGSFPGRMRALTSDLSVVAARLVLPDSLASKLPSVSQGFSDFGGEPDESVAADELPHVGVDPEAMSSLLEGIASDPSGAHYIHLLLPHVPWRYLQTGQHYQRGEIWEEWSEPDGLWPEDQDAADRALRAHLLQAGYADLLLGQILDAVRDAGIWDQATIAVVADHGSSFEAGTTRRLIEPGNMGAIAPMPFLVKAPGQERGRIDERPATTADVFPTIADLLEVELPFEVDGRPAPDVRQTQEVSILRGDEEEPRSFDLGQILADRDRIAARIAGRFGTGWRGVYRYGPSPELIGQQVDALSLAPVDPGESTVLTGAADFAAVDPQGDFIPALISGRPKGIPTGQALAIALNGRIVATAEVYQPVEGPPRFAALVPPGSFRQGANEVSVLRIVGTGLRPVAKVGEE
ncbi:MAG: sulfatase-like hydrolase/transferase [Actinomycetota bacterium]|nr:sulfatase-like hydrolase/transferase [Actinomycetota bacterium]